jgi:hypothetical protein
MACTLKDGDDDDDDDDDDDEVIIFGTMSGLCFKDWLHATGREADHLPPSSAEVKNA